MGGRNQAQDDCVSRKANTKTTDWTGACNSTNCLHSQLSPAILSWDTSRPPRSLTTYPGAARKGCLMPGSPGIPTPSEGCIRPGIPGTPTICIPGVARPPDTPGPEVTRQVSLLCLQDESPPYLPCPWAGASVLGNLTWLS